MDVSRYSLCLWPGLPELWYRGHWSGLPAAIMFTVAFNFLVVSRFIYPEWLEPSLVRVACWVAFGVWGMVVVRAAGRLPALINPRAASDNPDSLPEGRQHFLAGRWSEAEAALAACLEIDPRDCQALLLLTAVYRHTDRLEAAERTLDLLGRLETADGWWLECEAERQRVKRFRESLSYEEEPEAGSQPNPPEIPSDKSESSSPA